MLFKYLVPVLFVLLILFQFQCTFPEPDDITPPVVTIIFPYNGSVLSDSTRILVEATDDEEVSRVWVYFDDKQIASTGGSSGKFDIDVSTYADDQNHVIQAGANDESGNSGYSTQILVTISDLPGGDQTPPSLVLLFPAVGAILRGSINVAVDVFDNTGVDSVQFYVNGVWGNTDTDSPWGFLWNTGGLAPGLYTLYMKAHDSAGNVGTAGPITFTKN